MKKMEILAMLSSDSPGGAVGIRGSLVVASLSVSVEGLVVCWVEGLLFDVVDSFLTVSVVGLVVCVSVVGLVVCVSVVGLVVCISVVGLVVCVSVVGLVV